MLKKDITYTDFNGTEVTEEFHFHLSKADLIELEMSKKGGLEAWIRSIVAERDGGAIIQEFQKLILMSVGRKSPDGRTFEKSVDIRNRFRNSPAFDVLFMELVTDATKAAEFVNGIIPQGVAVPPAVQSGTSDETTRNVFEQGQTDAPQGRLLTQTEMIEMDSEELKRGLAAGEYRLQ